MEHTFKAIKQELELARAEEAEALRRAHHLRSRGAPWSEVRAAMLEADVCHSRVARLQQELRSLREPA